MLDPHQCPHESRNGAATKSILILVSLFSVIGVWIVFAARDTRESARRSTCMGHFCQLNLAMHCYHDVHGTLPPAHVADENGTPVHSWRVLLLPFMDGNDLYKQYDFDEPWNGPNNRRLASSMPEIFRCPSYCPEDDQSFHTNYVVAVGAETAFPGSRSVRLAEITDDTSKTIMLAETCNANIHWMEPRDLNLDTMVFEINSNAEEGISSMHHDSANVIRVNGHYRPPLMTGTAKATVRALLTIGGNETVGYY